MASLQHDKANNAGKDVEQRQKGVYLPYIKQLNCPELQKLEQYGQDARIGKLLREL
jgi:hypothetical protein